VANFNPEVLAVFFVCRVPALS